MNFTFMEGSFKHMSTWENGSEELKLFFVQKHISIEESIFAVSQATNCYFILCSVFLSIILQSFGFELVSELHLLPTHIQIYNFLIKYFKIIDVQ